jgi:AcrR family transcriptional regulator
MAMGRPRLAPDAIAAAEVQFAELGFEGARLSDIAAAAGISRPSLLYHFESKLDLYTAVVRTALLRLGEALVLEIEGRDDFKARLARAVARFVEFVEERPAIGKLLLREILDRRGPGHAILIDAGVPVLERIERFLREEGRGQVPPRLPLRSALLMLVASVLLRVAAGPLRDPLWGPVDHHVALMGQLLTAHQGGLR